LNASDLSHPNVIKFDGIVSKGIEKTMNVVKKVVVSKDWKIAELTKESLGLVKEKAVLDLQVSKLLKTLKDNEDKLADVISEKNLQLKQLSGQYSSQLAAEKEKYETITKKVEILRTMIQPLRDKVEETDILRKERDHANEEKASLLVVNEELKDLLAREKQGHKNNVIEKDKTIQDMKDKLLRVTEMENNNSDEIKKLAQEKEFIESLKQKLQRKEETLEKFALSLEEEKTKSKEIRDRMTEKLQLKLDSSEREAKRLAFKLRDMEEKISDSKKEMTTYSSLIEKKKGIIERLEKDLKTSELNLSKLKLEVRKSKEAEQQETHSYPESTSKVGLNNSSDESIKRVGHLSNKDVAKLKLENINQLEEIRRLKSEIQRIRKRKGFNLDDSSGKKKKLSPRDKSAGRDSDSEASTEVYCTPKKMLDVNLDESPVENEPESSRISRSSAETISSGSSDSELIINELDHALASTSKVSSKVSKPAESQSDSSLMASESTKSSIALSDIDTTSSFFDKLDSLEKEIENSRSFLKLRPINSLTFNTVEGLEDSSPPVLFPAYPESDNIDNLSVVDMDILSDEESSDFKKELEENERRNIEAEAKLNHEVASIVKSVLRSFYVSQEKKVPLTKLYFIHSEDEFTWLAKTFSKQFREGLKAEFLRTHRIAEGIHISEHQKSMIDSELKFYFHVREEVYSKLVSLRKPSDADFNSMVRTTTDCLHKELRESHLFIFSSLQKLVITDDIRLYIRHIVERRWS